ncbi:MAG: dTMP kinase [bacterium]
MRIIIPGITIYNARPQSGKLIVFEGIDGSGKTTQIKRTAIWLQRRGLTALLLREPTFGPYGRILQHSAHSGRLSPENERDHFVEDRRWNVQYNIRPALLRGSAVLLDRYYFSSIAYQGARGLDLEDIRRRNEAVALPPDLVLLFDLDPEVAVQRIQKQRGEALNLFEKLEYLRRVREIYLSLSDPIIWRIDAALSPDQVWAQVREVLLPLFASFSNP